ncbi:MAG: IS1634 family transposase [Clostridia bacterium]
MFLDCFKNTGKPYLRIVEGYYFKKDDGSVTVKRRTIKNLGPLSNFDDGQPDLLKRLREKFKNNELIFEGYEDIKNDSKRKVILTFEEKDFISSPKNIGYFVLDNIYTQLGISDTLNRVKYNSRIQYDLNGITKLLVFDRILHPSSKKKAFEERNDYLFPITTCEDLDQIYRALDVLDEKTKSIQLKMNTKMKNSSIGRSTDLTYYDVTNYYFETMYGDDDIYEIDEDGNILKDDKDKPIIKEKGFRKKGVSKENRKEPIVQMGLFIDNNGLPVSYKLFPGNTQDKTTFKDVLENDVEDMSLGKIVVVADNGMNTQENKYLITEQGNGYIVSKSVKKSWTKLRDWALDESTYNNIKNSSGEVTFKYKSRINEIKLTYKNEDGTKCTKTVKEKEIIYWSKKHYDREVFQNQKFIEYLESCKENPDKLKDKQRKSQEFIDVVDVDKKTGEIIKTDKLVVFLDEKLEKYKETMGFYSIVTSEIDTEDQEVINKYHGLSRIEDSFRVIKSDLEGRPIHVWTKEHINAHFLICFIALTIIRIIQYKVLKNENKNTLNVDGWEQGITAEKIKYALNNFRADRLPNDYYKITDIEDINKVYNSLGITLDLTIPTQSKLRNLMYETKSKNI